MKFHHDKVEFHGQGNEYRIEEAKAKETRRATATPAAPHRPPPRIPIAGFACIKISGRRSTTPLAPATGAVLDATPR